jgi:hypothetical protein
MISRALSLLAILLSFACGLLFVGTDGFAGAEPRDCGMAAAAGLFMWAATALGSVFVPGVLGGIRALRSKPSNDLERMAGVALGGHAALIFVGCVRFIGFA